MPATGTITVLPKTKGYDLVLGVAYTDKPSPSASGKSVTLATTGGAIQLEGGANLNMTVYRKNSKK